MMRDRGQGSHLPGAQRPIGELAATALAFNLGAEVARLKDEATWQRENHNARTLVKESDLRIVLVAMKQGARMAEHTAAGRLSIEVLVGEIIVHLPDQVIGMPAGSLLALDRQVLHDVEAREESAFLLTIMWPDQAT